MRVSISVIIPVYNEARTIAGVIDAVCRWGKAHQIIVVDDGSTDHTVDVVQKLGRSVDIITEGMRKACEPGGTGWPLFNFQITNPKTQTTLLIPVACKTGTAEFGDPQNRTHAWFTVFGPIPASKGVAFKGSPEEHVIAGDPEISVTVLVEGAGEGSTVAAPVAKKILEEWFSR